MVQKLTRACAILTVIFFKLSVMENKAISKIFQGETIHQNYGIFQSYIKKSIERTQIYKIIHTQLETRN